MPDAVVCKTVSDVQLLPSAAYASPAANWCLYKNLPAAKPFSPLSARHCFHGIKGRAWKLPLISHRGIAGGVKTKWRGRRPFEEALINGGSFGVSFPGPIVKTVLIDAIQPPEIGGKHVFPARIGGDHVRMGATL